MAPRARDERRSSVAAVLSLAPEQDGVVTPVSGGPSGLLGILTSIGRDDGWSLVNDLGRHSLERDTRVVRESVHLQRRSSMRHHTISPTSASRTRRPRQELVALAVALIGVFSGVTHANLVVNGDFEDPGLVGINSDYVHTPNGNIDEGTWWAHPWDPGAPWHGTQSTPDGMGAMSVNGDDSSQAGEKRVWYQDVPVEAGKTYRFTTWALATQAGFTGYSLRFAVDGTQLGGVVSPTVAFGWELWTTTFVATDASAELSIVNVSGITFPNDFMLDDISLVEIVSSSDIDGDGAVDGADLGILLGFWGPCPGCEADINGDGEVDGRDLGILLADWTG